MDAVFPNNIDSAALAAIVAAPFIGSFLGLLVVRLPRGEPVVAGRSRCRACGHTLAVRDLVPILGWLWSGARCRYCEARVSALYPAMELSALLIAIWSALILDGWVVWAGCFLGYMLLTLAVIDFRDYMLPDVLTIPMVATGLVVAYLIAPYNILSHIIGAAAGFAIFWGISYAYARIRGREGLGVGDAKLMAGAGAWVSWIGLPMVLLYGSLTALFYVGAMAAMGCKVAVDTKVPFGTFLCLGIWLTWVYRPLLPS